jgi:hypothetical protein
MKRQISTQDPVLKQVTIFWWTVAVSLAALWILSIIFDWFPPSSFVLETRGYGSDKSNVIYKWTDLDKPGSGHGGFIIFGGRDSQWSSISGEVKYFEVIGRPRFAMRVTGPVSLRVQLTVRGLKCEPQEFYVPPAVTRDICVFCPPKYD